MGRSKGEKRVSQSSSRGRSRRQVQMRPGRVNVYTHDLSYTLVAGALEGRLQGEGPVSTRLRGPSPQTGSPPWAVGSLKQALLVPLPDDPLPTCPDCLRRTRR